MRQVGQYGPHALVGYGPWGAAPALVGYQPVVGAGFMPQGAPQLAPPPHMAAMIAPPILGTWPGASGAPMVQQQAAGAPVQGGQFPIGFGPTAIVPGQVNTLVTTRNQVDLYQPVRLVIVDSATNPAANFSINDIRHGNRSQLINANPIPALAFTQIATDSLVSFTAVKGGIDMVIEVANLSNTTTFTFQALYFGRAIGV